MSGVNDSVVEKVYGQIREMAISFVFKPEEKINEVALARQLGVSRTPLREALNRLTIEGLLRVSPGKGFYCRSLDVQEIFNLYELRKALEIAAVRLAVVRAELTDIDAAQTFLDSTGPSDEGKTVTELVALDEAFHERVMTMAGNVEMLRVLRNVNARIRFVRWIDIRRGGRVQTQTEHRALLTALRERNEAQCVEILQKHIDRRMDQIISAIREGYAHIYTADMAAGMLSAGDANRSAVAQ